MEENFVKQRISLGYDTMTYCIGSLWPPSENHRSVPVGTRSKCSMSEGHEKNVTMSNSNPNTKTWNVLALFICDPVHSDREHLTCHIKTALFNNPSNDVIFRIDQQHAQLLMIRITKLQRRFLYKNSQVIDY